MAEGRVKLQKREAEILCREAIKRGDRYTVEKVIEDPTFDGGFDDNVLIRWASDNGYLKIVKLLLPRKEVEPQIWDNYPITLAAWDNNLDIVRHFLKDTRVIRKGGHTLAFEAGVYKHNWAICVFCILSSGHELDISYYVSECRQFQIVQQFEKDRILSKQILNWFPEKYKLKVALLWFCLVKRGWKEYFNYMMGDLSKIIILH